MEWTAEALSELATGYWRSQALLAGVQTGLFDALPGRACEVAEGCGCERRSVELLLEALAALGLLECENGVFAIVPSAAAFLRSDSPTGLGAALALNGQMYGLWGKLATMVQSGRPVLPARAHLGEDADSTREFVMGMHARGMALLPAVAEAIDLQGVRTVLDVGSGPGTLSRLLCERHPGLRATLVDLPGITEVARELTAAHPTAQRIIHRAGDYLRDELPKGFEAVLYCGALHQHGAAEAPRIVSKLAGSLAPGGRLYVVDLMLRDDRMGPPMAALFGLNMALISPTSHIHSVGSVLQALREVGIVDLRAEPVRGGMYQLVSGRAV